MNNMKKIAIIGATSAIAEHCARLWAKDNPAEFILLGRDQGRLQRVAADLKVRSPETVIRVMTADVQDTEHIQTTVDHICRDTLVDIALVAHGYLPTQQDCQTSLVKCREALELNGISPVLFAEAFALHMEKANHGTIAIIGSVAGDRGRKSNYVYGAAKGLVARYAQGLQHRLATTKVKVLLIKPGPTDTPMTAHLKHVGVRLAAVDRVADDIVRAVEANAETLYTPGIWRLIMLVIKHVPAGIFKRTNL